MLKASKLQGLECPTGCCGYEVPTKYGNLIKRSRALPCLARAYSIYRIFLRLWDRDVAHVVQWEREHSLQRSSLDLDNFRLKVAHRHIACLIPPSSSIIME